MKKLLLILAFAVGLVAISGLVAFNSLVHGPSGDPAPPLVAVAIPPGAGFQEVVDILDARGLVRRPGLFRIYPRLKGADTQVRAGPYSFPAPASWDRLLTDLTEGRVLTQTMTIPEGFTLKQMAPRIAAITEVPEDSVLAGLTGPSLDEVWGVPGPGLEGYLFPDSYYLAQGVPLAEVLAAMVGRYREFWNPERIASREAIGMTEAEVVTLASIVQAEARLREEMPTIASVYHNRLARNHRLQADPTVLYALGGPRARLLYAAMDSVADHPYNTYTHNGLPPGPIGAPGAAALDAALSPAETDFFYFVAHPDGSHIFSRTLSEHNRAVAQSRRLRDRLRREQGQGQGNDPR
ncbi:MAG: endolytic transglycosylase MltG [Gemmatimonadetes bacterium]|nr:endolytic transglycosylase MltG [Gemmatimonadota bacterium]